MKKNKIIMKKIKIKEILKFLIFKTKITIQKKILIILFLMFIFNGSTPSNDIHNIEANKILTHEILDNNVLVKPEQYISYSKNKIKKELFKEVENYIYTIAPNTNLSATYLVDKCLEYNICISFVLAQGMLESHFGTKGIASRTNSVWNVGTYDNGAILYCYNHPNESVEPYLDLLKRRYLVGKDLHSLLQDKNFINDEGKRYASAKNYENLMRKLIIDIESKTNISLYQSLLTMENDTYLALFKPNK